MKLFSRTLLHTFLLGILASPLVSAENIEIVPASALVQDTLHYSTNADAERYLSYRLDPYEIPYAYHAGLDYVHHNGEQVKYIVLLLAGTPVGFCQYAYSRDRGTICYLGVTSRYQHHGYGNMLLTHAIHDIEQHGTAVVELEPSCSAVIPFYRKRGFECISGRYPPRMRHYLVDAKLQQDNSPETTQPHMCAT